MFDNCTQILHIPVLDASLATGIECAILYMAQPDTMAIALIEADTSDVDHNLKSIGLISPMESY